MATEKQIIEKYGKEVWDKMCATRWLDGITVKILENGEHDIPESDVDRAYRASKGEHIHDWD